MVSIPNHPVSPRGEVAQAQSQTNGIDLRGTIRAIRRVPGLFGLIFFHAFNNFLGGVLMALMDAYGLLLVSVQAWGILWDYLSLGFSWAGWLLPRKAWAEIRSAKKPAICKKTGFLDRAGRRCAYPSGGASGVGTSPGATW